MQQLIVVVLFMLVLPVGYVIWNTTAGTTPLMAAVGTWFVYWGVG